VTSVNVYLFLPGAAESSAEVSRDIGGGGVNMTQLCGNKARASPLAAVLATVANMLPDQCFQVMFLKPNASNKLPTQLFRCTQKKRPDYLAEQS
jgi:hypothetical protein